MTSEEFERECQRMRAIGDQYNSHCLRVLEEMSREVVRKEYSVGGEVMHRGYYCPNPIGDIIIDNAKRGRLLKRLTERSKPSYEYSFDHDDKLIIIRGPAGTEFIIRNRDNVELGISFYEEDPEYYDVAGISECTYDQGKIQTYIYYKYYAWNPEHRDYERIDYEYTEEGLSKADWFIYMGPWLISHLKYYFLHDEEGFLTHYRVEEYDGEIIKNIGRIDRLYEPPVKRKV